LNYKNKFHKAKYYQLQKIQSIVAELVLINKSLMAPLTKYENPKNSSNNSIPPSKDENLPFKSKSQREASAKSPKFNPGIKAKP